MNLSVAAGRDINHIIQTLIDLRETKTTFLIINIGNRPIMNSFLNSPIKSIMQHWNGLEQCIENI